MSIWPSTESHACWNSLTLVVEESWTNLKMRESLTSQVEGWTNLKVRESLTSQASFWGVVRITLSWANNSWYGL
jgi:hypothetical protein